jgi:SNF2 family DNA or RNA helicase
MEHYIVPYINITPTNNKLLVGKIKDSINCSDLINSGNILMNTDFVDLVNASNYSLIPIPGYYTPDVQQSFDMYGTIYKETHDGIEYTIKIYFYKIKNVELLTKSFIEQFSLIFKYDYFVKNNILNMDWHSYRLNLFTQEIEQSQFYNLAFKTPSYCKFKLFRHQINNISNMLDIYNNKHQIAVSDNLIINFENGLNYDMVLSKFIEPEEVEMYQLSGGMILDEPGTGKTLQFIIFLLECNRPSLVLVPNDDIKKVWLTEFKKHIGFESKMEVMTFNDVSSNLYILDTFEIIGIDEIHVLYSNKEYEPLFNAIINSNIQSRWGITGTPFVNDKSLFNIIKYLTGNDFKNERIANIPGLQNSLIKLFLKNMKINMTDDYQFPELNISNIFVELDIVQKNLYEMEASTTFNKSNLRKLVSQIQLMFNSNDIQTPSDLKKYCIGHYNAIYEKEVGKLGSLKSQLENVHLHKSEFKEEEYPTRVEHYNQLIRHQSEDVQRHKKNLDYFTEAIESISSIFDNKDSENDCPICYCEYTPPITYFKECGHYFCQTCIDSLIKMNGMLIKCPMCRKNINQDEIIIVSDVSEINDTPKLHELSKIILNSSERFIVFSQFNILDKFYSILSKKNISTIMYDQLHNNMDVQVLLLSSQHNAEGIDLSHFDNLIIFEPFEDHMYCKEIEKQLIGRIHRIGRTRPVNVFRLITKDTIEEEIYSSVM